MVEIHHCRSLVWEVEDDLPHPTALTSPGESGARGDRLLGDPDPCDKHSLLTDDSVVASQEVLGVEASQEKQEERNSMRKPTDPESSGESSNANEFRSETDQSFNKLKASDQNDVVEFTSTPRAMCSASEIQILEEEITTEDKNMKLGYEILQATSTRREGEHASTTNVSYKLPEADKKYIRMWHLMYKHAVLSNAEKGDDKLPSDKEVKEAQEKYDLSFNGVNDSSCQDTYDEDVNVVELVQKAFDEILLPEMEDISSDDHLKSRGMAVEEEGDKNTLTFRESPKEEAGLKLDDSHSHEEEKASREMGNEPELKTPKSWSSLKKLLLLKRFVKALEKVRKLSLRKPRKSLPSDTNPEAEKVYLRHLTLEEEKNVEEWMLDYALQKVISKLAPAQKRRVALLVEAFETVFPFKDTENGPPFSTVIETQATTVQALDDSSDYGMEVIGEEKDYGFSAKLLIDKALRSHKTFEQHADNANDNPMIERQKSNVMEQAKNSSTSRAIVEDWNEQRLVGNHGKEKNSIGDDNVCLVKAKDSVSLSFGTLRTSHEEDSTNEIVNEAPQDMISSSNTEISNCKSESHGRDFDIENPINESREQPSLSKSLILKSFLGSLGPNLVPSAASSHLLGEPVSDRKESIVKAKPETKNLKHFPTAEGAEIHQEKENHTGLWYLVYKLMASGITVNDFKPPVDGDDEKKPRFDNSRSTGTNITMTDESIAAVNQDIHSTNHPDADSQVKLRQLEAIKIVEDAIDAILPDAQEHSQDGQSVIDSMISGNSQQSQRTEGENGEGQYQGEERLKSDDGITQERDEEPELKEGSKPLPGSWSNLKKVIMLRRFIKALEKVRNFNPRGPRYLATEPNPEAEKVNLRHHDMGERKGSEEWMLDYALRQVVAKLTPARKRKVELLVEAFAAVMPSSKIETGQFT